MYLTLFGCFVAGLVSGVLLERRTNKTLKMVRRIQHYEPYALLKLSMRYCWSKEG